MRRGRSWLWRFSAWQRGRPWAASFCCSGGFLCCLGWAGWPPAFLTPVFCCLCGGAVFLCALAVDNGHLRLYQAVLQGLGAWCVVVALDPWVRKGSQAPKKIFWEGLGLSGGKSRLPAGAFFQQERPPRDNRGKKLEKRRKNREKRLENFMYTGL